MKKLVVLDAHAIIHRAYHALPDFVSSRGEPTGGLYGLSSMLIRLINDLKPDYLVACYDLPQETFRKELYQMYKSGRAKADEDLVLQLGRSQDIFTAFGIPIYSQPGFEADDVIGTVVEQTKNLPNLQVIIASGDMDTLQLVEGEKVVVYTLKKGFSETVLYDEKAVRGRFGFAPPFLADYKGLAGDPSDNIVGVPGIGEKTAAKLVSQFGTLENIYRLLKEDKEALLGGVVKERTLKLLTEGEEEAFFSKTLANIRKDVPVVFRLPDGPWAQTVDINKVEALFKELDFRTLAERVKAILSKEAKIEKSTEQITPELKIAAWLLQSDLTNPTAPEILGLTQTSSLVAAQKILEAEIKKQGLERVYRDIELPLVPIIASAEERGILIDLDQLHELSSRYRTRLEVLAQRIFKLVGEKFNLNSPKQLAAIIFDRLHLSPKGMKKTPGGVLSTRESELFKLKDTHPVIGMILEYRELYKLLSTYIDAIPPLLDKNQRLHTRLNQTGTTTGRMSSSNPNLQNIPIVGEAGRAIRSAFVAAPGFVWAAFDYSQIEMRVLALLSADEELQKIFQTDQDVHTGVAMRVFGVLEKDVTAEMRRRAKVINFGIIYGMGVNALRANLNSTREEAQSFLDDYFVTFPKIRDYLETIKTQAKKLGYTTTYFGRRRYLPGLYSPLPTLRAASERMALNAPIQGTAADIVKLAMIRADERLKKEGLSEHALLLLQVHDELIYEIEAGKIKEAVPLIKEEMENTLPGPVPFTVEIESGPNWGELC